MQVYGRNNQETRHKRNYRHQKYRCERKDQFARMLTEKLLAYACGRRIEALDRPQVDHIITELAKGNFGLRHLIELIVTSDAFCTP